MDDSTGQTNLQNTIDIVPKSSSDNSVTTTLKKIFTCILLSQSMNNTVKLAFSHARISQEIKIGPSPVRCIIRPTTFVGPGTRLFNPKLFILHCLPY